MIVPIFIDKKKLGESLSPIFDAEFKREQEEIEAARKRKRDKEEKKWSEKRERMRKESEYRILYPHCTEMFNHFDFGNEWFPVNYRW